MDNNLPENQDNESSTPKESKSKISQLKEKITIQKIILAPILFVLGLIAKILKRILYNPLMFGLLGLALGFLIGARLHDVGFLAGHFQKDLKGATVYLSGKCTVAGKERNPSLAEDQVKIISVDTQKIKAIVRQTREFVECNVSEVITDSLPILKNITKTPSDFPELEMHKVVNEEAPEYLKYEKKTLIVSGSCVTLDDQALPSFTDEKIAVTEISVDKDDPKAFSMAGIRKSDKKALKCFSKAITYELASKEDLVEPVKLEDKTTFISDTLLVSGTCFPDPRALSTSMPAKFYRLTNTKILVTDELMENKKLMKIYGKALAQEFRGIDLICDKAKMPFVYKEYNPNAEELDTGIQSNDGKKPELKTTELLKVEEPKLSNELLDKKE